MSIVLAHTLGGTPVHTGHAVADGTVWDWDDYVPESMPHGCRLPNEGDGERCPNKVATPDGLFCRPHAKRVVAALIKLGA